MICKAGTVSPSGHCLSTHQLIVALPLIALPLPLILSVHPCLSICHLHLPPPICLLFALAGCCVPSCCAAFATHPHDAQPPLNMPASCSNASCHPASAACPLSTLLPLDVPPPSPTPICLLIALAGGCVTSCCTAFATHPLYVLPHLNMPAGCSIASYCTAFATHPLDVSPSLNTPAGCSITSPCATSVAHPLSAPLPLNAPPSPPTSCLPFVCPG